MKSNTKSVIINGGREIFVGDVVICYTDDKSFSWNNGVKVVHEFINGMVGAYNIEHEGDSDIGITHYGKGILY